MEPIKNVIANQTNIPFLKKVLDVSSLKQKVIASNIANASTPGYKSKDIDFEKELKTFLNQSKTSGKRTNPAHLALGETRDNSPQVSDKEIVNSNSVNGVDIEKEMGDLSQNELIYKFGTRFMSRTFQLLKLSIKGE